MTDKIKSKHLKKKVNSNLKINLKKRNRIILGIGVASGLAVGAGALTLLKTVKKGSDVLIKAEQALDNFPKKDVTDTIKNIKNITDHIVSDQEHIISDINNFGELAKTINVSLEYVNRNVNNASLIITRGYNETMSYLNILYRLGILDINEIKNTIIRIKYSYNTLIEYFSRR